MRAEGADLAAKALAEELSRSVLHDIDVDQYASLMQLLEQSLCEHAQRPFSVCMEHWMSYRELDERSRALGAALQRLGFEPGERVGILLPNLPLFAVTGGG